MLDDVRERGWAIADEELEVGVRSIAVPIRDHTGVVIAAMNVAAVAGRASTSDLVDRFLPRLRAAAEALENDLRGGDGRPLT
jgi:IclR family pca regulon transcriptional regulator